MLDNPLTLFTGNIQVLSQKTNKKPQNPLTNQSVYKKLSTKHYFTDLTENKAITESGSTKKTSIKKYKIMEINVLQCFRNLDKNIDGVDNRTKNIATLRKQNCILQNLKKVSCKITHYRNYKISQPHNQ